MALIEILKSPLARMIGGTVIAFAGLTIWGLNYNPHKTEQKVEKNISPSPSYFAKVPMEEYTGLAMVCGDFDGDGDLDLIVGGRNGTDNLGNSGKLYLFKNDGKGNFSQ